MTKFRINLSDSERETLTDWVRRGKHPAKKIQKAQVILGTDEVKGRQSQTDLALSYHLSERSVERIRRAFCEEGMGIFETKVRKPRSDKKIDGRVEAHLIALVCSEPPQGYARWKLQLLADKLIEMQVIDSISATAVGTTLKKTNYSLSGRRCG
jgi:hypothetical protein